MPAAVLHPKRSEIEQAMAVACEQFVKRARLRAFSLAKGEAAARTVRHGVSERGPAEPAFRGVQRAAAGSLVLTHEGAGFLQRGRLDAVGAAPVGAKCVRDEADQLGLV